MKKEITMYELSTDQKGLRAYFADGQFYYIHSDELSPLENWIHRVLLRQEKANNRERDLQERLAKFEGEQVEVHP